MLKGLDEDLEKLKKIQERIDQIDEAKKKLEQAMASNGKKLWLPKVFCTFSHYLFYDKYVEIIK